MGRDIDVLNEEMIAAGIRVFVGGLHPAKSAKSLRAQPGGKVHITDGTYLETKEQFGCTVLIDCHSMPNNSRGAHAPDVVLGDRFGASCHPSVTALAEATLRRQGYRVARNAPFAGGHTTHS